MSTTTAESSPKRRLPVLHRMRLRSLARRFRGQQQVVIPALYTARRAFGEATTETLAPVCDILGVTPEWLDAQADAVGPERSGPVVVRVCTHENCARRHGQDVLDEARRCFIRGAATDARVQTSPCGRFRVESVGCLGSCTAPAAIEVNSELYDDVDRDAARWFFAAIARAPGHHP